MQMHMAWNAKRQRVLVLLYGWFIRVLVLESSHRESDIRSWQLKKA